MKKKLKKIRKKISLGIVLSVFIGFFPFWLLVSWLYQYSQNLIVEANSKKEVVNKNYHLCSQTNQELRLDEIKQGLVPEQIEIESVGIVLPVVVSSFSNGTWEVIDNIANWAEGTSAINLEKGNIGIFGHDRDNVFSSIKNLLQGDSIYLFSGNYKAIYIVEDISISKPEDVEVFYETEKPTLTLITCDGAFSEKRYTLRAKFDRIEELNCNE